MSTPPVGPAGEWKHGITPQVQPEFEKAAAAIRAALAAIDAAYDAAEPDTDVRSRCEEVVGHLEEAMYHIEWQPPAEWQAPS